MEPENLVREINASDGSFVASLRFDRIWEHVKFVRLCKALHESAKLHQGDTSLPRGLSQLFWYCGTFIPKLTDPHDLPAGSTGINYNMVVRLLEALGNEWFCEGDLLGDDELAEMIRSTAS